jgi:hypothetical protein
LTTDSDSKSKIFFKNPTNTQVNFAINKNGTTIKGIAKKYYIHTVLKNTNPTIMPDATNYLVIEHENQPFYVVFPIKEVSKVSAYLKNDRMNGGLANSIKNLNNSTIKTGSEIKFSLESVIDSMKTFNSTKYYVFVVSGKPVYVINTYIYVETSVIRNGVFAEVEGLNFNKEAAIYNATIRKVNASSTCTPSSTVVKTSAKTSAETIFSNLGDADQEKNNYINFALMLSSLLFLAFFYWLYYIKDLFANVKRMSILFFIIIANLAIIAPVGITAQVYNSKIKTKINKTDLRHSITFARYCAIVSGITLFMIFRKQLIDWYTGPTVLWEAIKNIKNIEFNELLAIRASFIIFIAMTFYFSYIIFLTV